MSLSPSLIFKKYRKNLLSLSETIDLLLILVENGLDIDIRIKSLEFLLKIINKSQDTFDILERILITDENEIIRAKAVKSLSNFHDDKFIHILVWLIRKDPSFLVLRTIKEFLKEINNPMLSKEFIKRIEHLASDLEIVPEEIDIILKFANNIDAIGIFKTKEGNFLILKDGCLVFVKDGYIRGISLSLFKRIPKSVFQLEKLEYLDLSFCYLTDLPDQLLNLNQLRLLNLQGNEFTSFPLIFKSWKKIEKLELNLSNNNINQLPEWIDELNYFKKLNLSNNNIQLILKDYSNSKDSN